MALERIRRVHLGERGAEVAKLHKGLRFIIRNQPGISDGDREMFQSRLAPEVSARTFGPVTAEIVGLWQNQLKERRGEMPENLGAKVRNLPILGNGSGTGDVDGVTAEALNWLLRKLGG
jgi:hypothetical protein